MKRSFIFIFIFIVILFSTVMLSASPRRVININRAWEFTTSEDITSGVRTIVNIPHTWNNDMLSSRSENYRGTSNYIKDIHIPSHWNGKRVYIRFKGVNSEANLFVNGKFVGEHYGGYTAFTFEITNFLRFGTNNNLWLKVNNASQLNYIPITGDFNIYGGIYRDVDLIVVSPVHISLTDNSSSGVYLAQKKVTEENAAINATVKLTGIVDDTYNVSVEVSDDEKNVVEKIDAKTKIEHGSASITIPLNIKSPKLWNGLYDAYQYDFTVKVGDNSGVTLDSITIPMGVRYYSIDPKLGFMLNGKPYKLQGVTKHQDRGGVGNAIRPRDQEQDMDLMLEMGVNAVRMTSYPQDQYFYDLCDRMGIIVWSEIPLVGNQSVYENGYINKTSIKGSGKMLLTEMISQNYNHASVMFWGLFSNLMTRGDDPTSYIKELTELSHELDPTRLTVGASNQDGSINFATDLIGWSQYLGWKEGNVSDVDVWLEQLAKNWGTLRSSIAEYGAGGSILHQEDSLKRPTVTGNWHPERWQTHFHEQFLPIINKHQWLWGSFVYTMFDYGSSDYIGGDTPGVNDYGLVSFDRRDKKDAFYFYKANWNKKQPFVYIAEKRWSERENKTQTIKVYSNQSEVELIINGETMGQKLGTNGIFTWEGVALIEGDNEISAFSGRVKDVADIYINTSNFVEKDNNKNR